MSKALEITNDSPYAFKIRLLCVGKNEYLLFIKDESSKSDYIRLSFGYADSVNQKSRIAKILQEYICEPKMENGTFLGKFNSVDFKNKKLWIIFETVRRQKNKRGDALERFVGLSPPQSKWKTSIGSYSDFELKKLSIQEFEQTLAGYLNNGVEKISEQR